MTEPISNFFDFTQQNKVYQIHYLDWGKAELPVVICAHGLTRNSRDFDYLARSISDQYRVVAIDFPGRGLSDWLEDKNSYAMPTYLEVVQSLLRELNIQSFNWLGTSMGGLIGIILAAQNSGQLKRLIINDVGPEIPTEAIGRINDYLSMAAEFDTKGDFESHIREIYAPFGSLTAEQWQHLANYSHRINSEGKLVSNYDPAIALAFKQTANVKADIWNFWQAITCPVYLLYGENSDILNPAIIAKMKRLQLKLKAKAIKNVGHAPALMDEEQIQLIHNWLND